ncbi:MAG: hypothetical protein U1E86_19025 [Burkholderiaceae bacterium]
MAALLRIWVVFVLGTVPADAVWATFRVVPEQKSAPVRRDETPAGKRAERTAPPAGTSGEPGARDATSGDSRCADELTSMSLGIDDPAARARLKGRRCE